MLPFLCACSDQTSMLGCVWGDVCISWSNHLVSLGSDKNLWTTMVYTILWLPYYGERITLYKNPVTERIPCLQGCICASTSCYSS
jgi:hypothetical protein